jgi:hypothetical protein
MNAWRKVGLGLEVIFIVLVIAAFWELAKAGFQFGD